MISWHIKVSPVEIFIGSTEFCPLTLRATQTLVLQIMTVNVYVGLDYTEREASAFVRQPVSICGSWFGSVLLFWLSQLLPAAFLVNSVQEINLTGCVAVKQSTKRGKK